MKKSSNEKEKHYFSHTMGCKKLAYYENETTLKVAYSKTFGEKKSMQEFLRRDPLAPKFPFYTPYQFAGNNCISGIDLDGLEYLDYREVRIKIIAGDVHINLENFNTTTRNAWKARDETTGGSSGNIGHSTKVGGIEFAESAEVPSGIDLDTDYDATTNPFQYAEANKIGYGAPTKANGTPDMRFKGNKLNASEGGATSTSPSTYGAATKGLGFSAAVLGLGFWALEQKQVFDNLEDQTKVGEHKSILMNQVAADLNIALSKGMIPKQYQNEKDMGNIASVVLSGTNPSANKEFYEIGMQIVKDISKNYRGTTIVTTEGNKSTVTPSDNTSVNKTIILPK